MSDLNNTGQSAAAQLELPTEELVQTARHRKFNWPLFLGLLIVISIAIMAFIGPDIAPRDPLEENLIIKVDDQWYVPPFPLFTPGFPLGSDQFGRDLWSRLLWAIRPTLIMVVVVAVIRLFIGVVIGLLAGWLKNRFGNLLDNLIEGALSIPVLLVALGAIAVVGAEYGIWAFIVGLSLTGWVETAQQVREQTKIIKGQTYIEAARALGSSNRQILGGHIVRQITPMLLMLFAFEISSTLMITAGLGFLGYYIGGDVWIEVGDFVARRLSGMPELGQMLATSWATLTEPWAMVAVGSTIFITILGFNLIGEGLRSSLNYVGVRRGLVFRMRERAGFWLEQHVFHPAGQVLRQPVVRVMITVVLAAAIFWFGGVQFLWPRVQGLIENGQETSPSSALAEALATPTRPPETQPSATVAEDGVQPEQPRLEPMVVWEYHHSSRFNTGAAFDPASESFYVGSQDTLLKFDLEGNLQWEVELPAAPFDGSPAVDSAGNIFIADRSGGLASFSPTGELLWHFISASAPNTVSGLVMAPDETLYYVVSDYNNAFVQAVSNQGEDRGVIQSQASNFRVPLSLSADGQYLFHRDEILDLSRQERVDYQLDLIIIRFLGGEDGNNYLISGQNMLPIALENNTVVIEEGGYSWAETTPVGPQSAPQAVLVNENQIARLMFTSPGGNSLFVWQDFENELLGMSRIDFSDSTITAAIDTERLFACGSGRSFSPEQLECAYVEQGDEHPLWEIDLGSNGPAFSGFYHEDTFYFSTGTGAVYAISSKEVVDDAIAPTEEPVADQTPEETSPTSGIIWRYPLEAEIEAGPYESNQGMVYLATDEELVILNPDGSERVRKQIDTSWLNISPDRFSQMVQPRLVESETWVAVMQDLSVLGLDENGETAWEFALENQPEDNPYFIDGILYIVDLKGILYKIDAAGLAYQFVPQAADRPASGLVVGEDGTVYYTITNRSQGFIQAVAPDGTAQWTTEVQTDSFYSDLYLSADGSQLFLKEDIFSAVDGGYVAVDYPFQINQFIPGRDGNNYAWSDRSVVQWTLGPAGFNVINTASLADFFGNQILSSPEFAVNANSVIWARQFSSGVRNWRNIFVTPTGEVLGQHVEEYFGLNLDFDPDTFTHRQCRVENDALLCGTYDRISSEFTAARRFEGLDALGEGSWIPVDSNSLLFVTSDQEIMKLDINLSE